MNATANELATLIGEDDNPSRLASLPIKSARGNMAVKFAPSLQAFPEADGSAVFGARFLTLLAGSLTSGPEEALAIGVLSQAAHDLRRFHLAINGIERELFLDAYSWIITDDFSWPYSFVNVCQALHVSPESMRAELLADASLGWFGHWIRLGERLSRLLRASLIGVFTRSRDTHNAEAGRSAQVFQRL